jgi:heavy metal sensor kinase
MNARSLRYRLVAWYAFWLAVVFAVAAVLLYFGLRHYLESNLGKNQLRRAERIARLMEGGSITPARNLSGEIGVEFAPEASGRFVHIARTSGEVLYQSGPPVDRSFDPQQVSAPTLEAGTRKERQRNGTDLILATLVLPDSAIVIETGESLAPAEAEVRRLLVAQALAFIVVAAVALGGGMVLVRRALRPVEEITRSAERITSRSLSERLPVPPQGDEFQHLSQALNRMIARLDDAFQHNRRFLADASHELRTPLTVLRSELEAIVRGDERAPDLREAAGDLLDEVERLAHIVESLFALSRLEAEQALSAPARFDFAKLVATTSEQMYLLAEDKGLTVTCETPLPVPVEGDCARLKQVIVNLLDNAIKFTPAGGTVRLAVRACEPEAVFDIEDTGIGIPAEAQSHVFERFFRVDTARSRQTGGAGIGLSIVSAICTAHHGRVEVHSELGSGSRFTVRLPLASRTSALAIESV